MIRHKPSEKLPERWQRVVIKTEFGWHEAIWNERTGLFQDDGANQLVAPEEIEWWADPMEEG